MEKILKLFAGMARKLNIMENDVSSVRTEQGSAQTPVPQVAAEDPMIRQKLEELHADIATLRRESVSNDKLDLRLHKLAQE